MVRQPNVYRRGDSLRWALPNNSGTIAKDIADLCWVMAIGDGRSPILEEPRDKTIAIVAENEELSRRKNLHELLPKITGSKRQRARLIFAIRMFLQEDRHERFHPWCSLLPRRSTCIPNPPPLTVLKGGFGTCIGESRLRRHWTKVGKTNRAFRPLGAANV